MEVIRVAVAVIVVAGRVLIAKRAAHQHQGNLWEFPGGKSEPSESTFDALQRECFEELDIWPTKIEPLTVINHKYPDKQVCLEVCWVRDYMGLPFGKEGQPLDWCPVEHLYDVKFPEANLAIIKAVHEKYKA